MKTVYLKTFLFLSVIAVYAVGCNTAASESTALVASTMDHDPLPLRQNYTIDCSSLVKIFVREYEQKFVQADTAMPYVAFKKTRLSLKVPQTEYIFWDDTTGEGYQEFFPKGMLRNFYVVEQLDYHNSLYYLIDKESEEMYNLIGPPKRYGSVILAIEGESVDNPADFELWFMDGTELKLQKRFTLNGCEIYGIVDAYLNDGSLYIKHMPLYEKYDYYKVKLY